MKKYNCASDSLRPGQLNRLVAKIKDKSTNMDDKEFIKEIMNMDVWQLLYLTITFPEYMYDSYYKIFGSAITKRFNELKEAK